MALGPQTYSLRLRCFKSSGIIKQSGIARCRLVQLFGVRRPGGALVQPDESGGLMADKIFEGSGFTTLHKNRQFVFFSVAQCDFVDRITET